MDRKELEEKNQDLMARRQMEKKEGAANSELTHISKETRKIWPILKQRCSADFEWVCKDCGQTVEPLTAQLDETIHYRRRSFCPCAAGQHLAQQQAQADKESEWIDQVNALIDNAGLNTGIYARFRFDKWDRDRQGQSSTKVYDLVMDYTNEVTQNGANWLYIHGDYGCGKTHLAVAAIKRCIANQGWTGRMTVWPELCQMTKETWGSNHGPSEAQLWNRVRTARILLIDDLDKTGTGEWAMGKLYALINHRLTKGLPTIITANDSLAELRSEWENSTRQHVHDLGLAVLSRIAEALWGGVKIEGDDQRWMR